MSYGTDYMDIPEINTRIRVGRVKKMTKTATVTEAPKTSSKSKYSKTRGEHAKDLIIAMLITGIVAFIGGMHFSNQQQAQVSAAVKSVASPSASAQAPATAPASK